MQPPVVNQMNRCISSRRPLCHWQVIVAVSLQIWCTRSSWLLTSFLHSSCAYILPLQALLRSFKSQPKLTPTDKHHVISSQKGSLLQMHQNQMPPPLLRLLPPPHLLQRILHLHRLQEYGGVQWSGRGEDSGRGGSVGEEAGGIWEGERGVCGEEE